MSKWEVEVGGIAVVGALFLAAAPFADAPWTCVILGAALIVLNVKISRAAHPGEGEKP